MRKQRFPFSQTTFGGTLACTAIATLSASGFAEGKHSSADCETYCRAGSRVWKSISNQTISVNDILLRYDFFRETYDIESFQCCVEDSGTENDKYMSLRQLLLDVQKHASVGMVFTDGAASFAAGRDNSLWWIFDSHGTASISQGSFVAFTSQLRASLRYASLVDCTTFVVKDD